MTGELRRRDTIRFTVPDSDRNISIACQYGVESSTSYVMEKESRMEDNYLLIVQVDYWAAVDSKELVTNTKISLKVIRTMSTHHTLTSTV